MNKKRIAVLGATGSIGRQCLEVISNHPQRFEIEVITARSNTDMLIEQAIKYQPNIVIISEASYYNQVKEALAPYPIKVFAGEESLCDMVAFENIDIVFNALVGFSGLAPTLSALRAGKPVALANKETLVAGGDLVMKAALHNHAPIIPVDSEHSAIFQCLLGERSPIKKIVLTASGGPFWHTSADELPFIRKEQALKHPNWNMGEKVTIDSATMMNKGLEVIEAHWLFGVSPSIIDVIIHPQSIIHSMVQFEDGSVKAQMSHPDMRIPIQFALSFPQRFPLDLPEVRFEQLKHLDFYPPDFERFPCLTLAYSALKQGGNMPCALNAANEVAVSAFLNDSISFHQVPVVIEKTIQAISFISQPTLSDIHLTNNQARIVAQNLLKTF
ncbi:MAG: 1-deoxy-D-xylulose-5-phosphate reductoisomerase [Bacteroidales bacterium]|nr:1-deoxy-D-xylulose-5-phosphate reductoisomerase [Bacteroidales bacterium]